MSQVVKNQRKKPRSQQTDHLGILLRQYILGAFSSIQHFFSGTLLHFCMLYWVGVGPPCRKLEASNEALCQANDTGAGFEKFQPLHLVEGRGISGQSSFKEYGGFNLSAMVISKAPLH